MLNDIIPLSIINTTLIKVSEKILDSNIDKFLLHNIKNHNQNIFYSYLSFTKEYFICSYENIKRNKTIIELILIYIKEKEFTNKRVLVYFEEYFILIENSKFYYFQKIEKELLEQDINEYVRKRFNYELDEVVSIKSLELSNLTVNKSFKTTLIYINDTRALKIYSTYLIILFFLTFSLIGFDYYSKVKKEQDEIRKEKNRINHQQNIVLKDRFSYKTSLLLNKIENESLKISKFDFTNKSLHITFISKNRDDAYDFLQKYKNIKVNSFLEIKDGYEISSTLTF